MGKLKNLMIETDEEREVFERLQRDNALQALHDENERLGLYKPDEHLRLMEELAVARMLIRELGDRLSKLEKPWVGLTQEELCEIVGVSTNDSDWNVYKVQEWLRKVEAKLKERNT